jgi:hypothetical protein
MMGAVSNDLGNTTVAGVPAATRVSRSGWRDPRLWIGVLLVTASVVAGARLLAAADDTVAVWAAVADLGAGAELTEADVEVRRVRFADGTDLDHYFRADEALPADAVLVRGVGPGELLPRSAVGARADAGLLHVPLEVEPHQAPPAVTTGSVIDVYLGGAASGRRAGQGPALQEVTVVAAPPVEESFAVTGARQLVVAVPEDDAVAFQERYDAFDDPRVRVLQRS